MKQHNINGKNIYIVENHHEVLEAWTAFREMNIFTLDYHTDTMPAFRNYAYWKADEKRTKGYDIEAEIEKITGELISQYLSGAITIYDCISKLKHDEHIDFAIRAGIANKIFSFGAKRGGCGFLNKRVFDDRHQTKYYNHSIIEYAPICTSQCIKRTHDDECFIKLANAAIESDFLIDGEKYIKKYALDFFDKYILDIDLDYFNTEKSLCPDDPALFHRLIRSSDIITIACESSCVESEKLEGENIDAEKILNKITSHIKEATKK